MIVSNIGVYPDLSAIYTTNASHGHGLRADQPEGGPQHRQLRIHAPRADASIAREMPELSAYYQAGGLVDAVINQGLPAPIDIQIKSQNMDKSYELATATRREDSGDARRCGTSTFRRASTIPAWR